jgi:hypothetical protein
MRAEGYFNIPLRVKQVVAAVCKFLDPGKDRQILKK